MLISLLTQNPILFILLAGALIISLAFHEYAHAAMANYLGDPTAKELGRLTLSPFAHLDPVGTIMLFVAGIGWGKPVVYNPYNLQNPKRDGALIAFAGPLSNLVLGVVVAVLFNLLSPSGLVGSLMYFLVYYNLVLCFFNMLPVHPLDGFKVIEGLLSEDLSYQWRQVAPFGFLLLAFLVLTRSVGIIISPVVDLLLKILGLAS